MKEIINWFKESKYTTPLAPACKMCAEGSKMVVFVTGMCSADCYYCPISFKKSGKDRIFADEWELKNENEIEKLILEAELIEAAGAGITGGDPLIVWERVEKYIKFLKERFGEKFNIHLYTSGLKNADKISNLIKAGLDEVRFHPPPKEWKNMHKSKIKDTILGCIDSTADVAIEIPAVPNMQNDIFSMISWAEQNNLSWINLNELEFSEKNEKNLIKKGFTQKSDISAAVKGSEKTAIDVIKKVRDENLNIGIHYCSVSFKDCIQLKNRIIVRHLTFRTFEYLV